MLYWQSVTTVKRTQERLPCRYLPGLIGLANAVRVGLRVGPGGPHTGATAWLRRGVPNGGTHSSFIASWPRSQSVSQSVKYEPEAQGSPRRQDQQDFITQHWLNLAEQ